MRGVVSVTWTPQGASWCREGSKTGLSGSFGGAKEGFDIGRGGHGGLCAVAGDGDGGDGGGEFDAGDGVGSAQQGGGEGAVEGVAGGGGIDGLYVVRGDQNAFAGGEGDVAA